MSESLSTTCAETGRTLATAEAARASEARFLEIQALCDAGQVPELRPGDVIYVDSSIYLSHGCDDFRGGLAEVVSLRAGLSVGSDLPYVCFAQDPGTWHNWQRLAAEQKQSRFTYGFSDGNGDCNCTTWLERIGLPLLTGRMSEFGKLPGIAAYPSRRFGECT